MRDNPKGVQEIEEQLVQLNIKYKKAGYRLEELKKVVCPVGRKSQVLPVFSVIISVILPALYVLHYNGLFDSGGRYLLGIRCVIPNNYFVWEATRPLSDCHFCTNVTTATVLPNLTHKEFSRYAYTSKPIVVKGAFSNWPAMKVFDFEFFKQLYEGIEGAYRSVDEECQFLHFQSNFISLRDVFAMSHERRKNYPGQVPWYVGWGNCHPELLAQMRSFYPKPHFLPEDCEIPSKEYVFMGYDAGATMHLDFINRLMWQAQLKGTKTWYLKPPPECDNVCKSLSFVVEPGDAVLVDTRVWYHGTAVSPGQFSLSIQSEYG